MIFKSISINNFRNFENITINLNDKNVIFGTNDIGKTNFLYALRFLFDKNIRKNGFTESDYHQRNTNNPIKISIKIDISDTENSDTEKIIAKMKESLHSNDEEAIIEVIGEFNRQENIGFPILYWGGAPDRLQIIKNNGFLSDLDRIFNPIYIDAYVDLYTLFKKNIPELIKTSSDKDEEIFTSIKEHYASINSKISELSGIKDFERELTQEYNFLKDENVEVSIKSEVSIDGYFSNIIPYIKKRDEDSLFPTSGEGRKKLLVYSIFDILSKLNLKKINIFLIEEPENHLHRSLQIRLSNILFENNKYNNLFITTHSPYILSNMDSAHLIRLYNKDKIIAKSYAYDVPDLYKSRKNVLNSQLSESLFYDNVLLVEGPSEKLLFEKVFCNVLPDSQLINNYILAVNGIAFSEYFKVLKGLNIKTFVKTDNDLQKIAKKPFYSLTGFSRINGLIGSEILSTTNIAESLVEKKTSVEAKRELYNQNKSLLDQIREEQKIYLSRCSLEEDLDEEMHDRLVELLEDSDPVKYLKKAKKMNMAELVNKMTKEDCKNIYNSYNFACLKDFTSLE